MMTENRGDSLRAVEHCIFGLPPLPLVFGFGEPARLLLLDE